MRAIQRILALGAWWTAGGLCADSITIYEKDGTTQTARPVTIGRAFVQGEFPQCLQPTLGVGGAGISTYQVDVKNRWGDGSVKFAIVSFTVTLSSNGSQIIGFLPAASCNNPGSLSQSQMVNFNGGNWGAAIQVAANSITVTTDAKTMLNASDPALNLFNDCKNDYWLQGPVVTAVIVQDCTSASTQDFGWKWDGTTMNTNAGSAYAGNSTYASLHPWFILYFYPSTNQVRADMILENDWIGRWQDQLVDIVYKTGNPLTNVLSQTGSRKLTNMALTNGGNTISGTGAGFSSTDVGLPVSINGGGLETTICSITSATSAQLCAPAEVTTSTGTVFVSRMIAGTRYRKTFWTGAGAPGFILVDHNFAYLTSTKALPNYDLAVAASPDSSVLQRNFCSGTDYNCFASTTSSDKGDRGGHGTLDTGYSGNDEGAPLQREDLLYLYNMAVDCGTANGKCAKAWYMLTATRGAADSALAASVTGGAGVWNSIGNVNFHNRESRTAAGSFYCPGQADKNATPSSACGTGVGTPTGRVISRYYDKSSGWLTASGPLGPTTGATSTNGGWFPDLAHWINFFYVPYLLTGDYYYYDEQMMSAAWTPFQVNPGIANWTSNGFYAYLNPAGAVVRLMAWGLQELARAAFIAVDGTPEASYFTSLVNSNAEVQEGFMGITGSNLTPSSTNPTCASYNMSAANRWDWGRCTVASLCTVTNGTNCSAAGTPAITPSPLHDIATGQCANAMVGNGNLSGSSITAASTPSAGVTRFTTGTVPANGSVVTLVGGAGNWAAMNGNRTVSATGSGTFDVSLDSSAFGTLSGATYWYNNGFGLITAATQTNPTSLTTSNFSASESLSIYGATGAGNWQNLNAAWSATRTGTNTFTVPLNATAYPGFSQSGVYHDDVHLRMDNVAGVMEPWMESFFMTALVPIVDMGFTGYQNVLTERIKATIEQTEDSGYNPYLGGQYVRPVKDPAGNQQCNVNAGADVNPFYSTWAGVLTGFVPLLQNMSTYDSVNFLNVSVACGNHGYSTVQRAAIATAAGFNVASSTCTPRSGESCDTASAWTWAQSHIPYFNNTVTGSTPCGANSDIQIKFALSPRVTVAPSPGSKISGKAALSGTMTLR